MSAYSSSYQATPGGWSWPADLKPGSSTPPEDNPTTSPPEDDRTQTPTDHIPPPSAETGPKPARAGHWRPRQCRICLDVVYPTFSQPLEHVPAFLQSEPTASYTSEEGRLISPCKCKGSSRYVHEACLQEWRHADPSYGRRFYYECPTCHFQYRLERMQWGRWVTSGVAQVGLTILIFISTVFVLGFIADPIIDLYFDPVSAIASVMPMSGQDAMYEETSSTSIGEDALSWMEHFLKGFASLGLIGSAKYLFFNNPWWNLRHSGLFGGNGGRRAGQTGRDRISNLSWMMVIFGIITFIVAVWKFVRSWSRRVLEKAGERVMDVQGDNADDDEEEDNDTHAESRSTESAQHAPFPENAS